MTISGSPLTQLTAGTSARLLLAVNISSALTPGTTFQFNVTTAAYSGGSDLSTYPINGATWTVRDPDMPFNLYYRMNEGSGTITANDAVPGTGNDPAPFGITTAANWVTPGKLGANALDFSTGNGSGIATGWTSGLTANDDWTIETWMRSTATTVGYPFRFQTSGLYLYRNTATTFTLFGTGAATNPSWTAPALNAWQHVAFSYAASTGQLSLYLDGVLDSVYAASPSAAGQLVVGSYSLTSTRFYGHLDEFRVWDVARSGAEIQAGMNTELPIPPSTVLSASTTGGVFPTVPQSNLVVMDMQAGAFVNNNSVNSVMFTQIGTAADADFTSVELYLDNNNDGAVDGGDTLLDSDVLAGGAVTFSGSPLQALTAGTPVRLLLAVDTTAGFTLNNTVQFQVTNSSSITWGGGTDLTAFPVVGGEWKYSTVITRQFGGGASNNTFPFNSGTAGWRYQNAYSAAELNMPPNSVITEVRIWSTGVVTPIYHGLRIRLAHTILAPNALTGTFDTNYSGNLATCLGPTDFAPTQDADGYYVFPLAIPFLYNGVDGVLIDYSFNSRTGTGFNVNYLSGDPRSRVYQSGGNYLSPTGTANATTGNFRIEIDLDHNAPAPQPVIGLSRSATIANGGTDVLGNVPSPQGASFTWTIANSGTVDLNILTPVDPRPGSGAPTVTVTAQPATVVAGSTVTTFTLQILPPIGAFNFQVWITSNDLSDNPFVFTVSGTGIGPDMGVARGATPIAHTGTDSVGTLNMAGQSFTWTISNSDLGDLLITTPIGVTPGTGNPAVNVSQQPGNTVTQGNSTPFTIQVTPTVAGAFNFQVSITNNDPTNNPYIFTVSGDAIAPDMDISRTTAIASAGIDDVGNVSTAGQSFTWTITNAGNDTLDITTPIVVTPGTGAPGVNVTAQPANSVTQAATTTFTMTITPAVGAFDLQVSISSDDPIDNPYTFTVEGNGFIPNDPAVADPAASSVLTGPTNGPFTTAIMPGATLANVEIELTDPEADNITVTAITLMTAPPTGITAPAIPGAGQPITLGWTGMANATNPPGDYIWEVDFADAVNGTPVTVEVIITIGNPAPTHQIANASGGDGSAANPYTAAYTETMDSSADIDLASVTDANVGQALSISGSPQPGAGNPAGGVGFVFVLANGFLNVVPGGALAAADIGTHTYDVDVTDGTNIVTIAVSIDVAAVPLITTASPLPSGEQGQGYAPLQLNTSGGTGILSFALTFGSLPNGLSLSTGGLLSGTPTAQGAYNFTVSVTDANNIAASKVFDITIDPPATGNPSITTTSLPGGTVGQNYGPVSVQATGGTGSYTFAVSAGNLPPGLALNGLTGEITGNPTTAAVYSFDVTVTDSAFATATQSYQVTIMAKSSNSGGDGGGGGGCAADSDTGVWGLLLGALALLATLLRMRAVRD